MLHKYHTRRSRGASMRLSAGLIGQIHTKQRHHATPTSRFCCQFTRLDTLVPLVRWLRFEPADQPGALLSKQARPLEAVVHKSLLSRLACSLNVQINMRVPDSGCAMIRLDSRLIGGRCRSAPGISPSHISDGVTQGREFTVSPSVHFCTNPNAMRHARGVYLPTSLSTSASPRLPKAPLAAPPILQPDATLDPNHQEYFRLNLPADDPMAPTPDAQSSALSSFAPFLLIQPMTGRAM
jgi:hypothetical protein